MKIDRSSPDYIRGYQCACGVWGAFVDQVLFAILVILLLFGLLRLAGISPFHDDTDPSRWEGSGLTLLKDHGTGKEYLYRGGALIERAPKPRPEGP